jgi:PAS domain S-box-containing protein
MKGKATRKAAPALRLVKRRPSKDPGSKGPVKALKSADRSIDDILLLLKTRTQIDLSEYKVTTLQRRIQRQMMLQSIPDLNSYFQRLKTSSESLQALYDDIFIHVTEFFRNPDCYQALRKQVFPSLVKNLKADDLIRIWVPGCSTGEEAYSLTIELLEFLEDKNLSLRLQVFATDISEKAIQVARRGVYAEDLVANVGKERLQRFFEKTAEGYRIRKEVRELCVVSRHDLTRNPPFVRLDLISCRNVLIYFGQSLQRRVLPVFHYALKSTGFLWLGQAESIGNLSDHFSLLDKKHKIYSKIEMNGPSRSPQFPSTLFANRKVEISDSRRSKSGEELTSLNEELQAANEELHSTNEELETAQEELQAANEEMTTMNDELQLRNVELSALNDKLARGETRFRLMVEGVKDYAIFMLNPDGKVASWNEGARRLKGYESSEIIGEHFSKFYPLPDIAEGTPELELEEARIEGRVEKEGWRLRKDGSRFWANVIVTRINDQQGGLVGYSKVTRDLTEKREAHESLRRSEERFRQMVSAVKDYALFMLDAEGRVASWNEGARRIKGYEPSEIIGKKFSIFYTPEDVARKHPDNELRIAKATGRYEEAGWRVRKDGTRFWANVVIARMDDAVGNHMGFVKVTRDLTERKQAEEELQRAHTELEQRVIERTRDLELALNSRDEFLSIASHELKTPLTSLKLQLQMTRRKIKTGEASLTNISPQEIDRALDLGIRQTNSITDLVDDLLDVSRIQSGSFGLSLEEIKLFELVEDVVARFSQQLTAAGCQVDLKLDRSVAGRWDRHRLQQVILNLLSNAIKYAPGKPVVIAVSMANDIAKLVVQDQGPGIEKEMQKIIFERFERGTKDRNIGGLGLGLFIVRRIVEAHHGEIRVESAPGKGAKFIVELPLDPESMRNRGTLHEP